MIGENIGRQVEHLVLHIENEEVREGFVGGGVLRDEEVELAEAT